MDRPALAGLIAFAGGVSRWNLPVDALTWGPVAGNELMICLWVARRRMELAIQYTHGHEPEPAEPLPPLIPVAGESFPINATATPVADIPEEYRTIVTILATSWHLMQQPTLSSGQNVRPDSPTGKWLARKKHPASPVTLIDLRRRYIPNQYDDNPSGTTGREYRHQWVVSGHWRDQPYGPERSHRRRQWIPAYVKGPEGAPLLATTKVNVWRR